MIPRPGSSEYLYILTAVIPEEAEEERARPTLLKLLRSGQDQYHWRAERREKERRAAVAALEQIPHGTVSIVLPYSDRTKQERARRRCMERLLFELAAGGVSDIIVEARGKKDDRKDLETLDFMRQRRMLPAPLHIHHQIGREQPLLWIPDIVCGLVGLDLREAGEMLDTIRSAMTVHHLES